MLSNKNNLRSELTGNVGVLATSISITAWEWVLWENNMVACLEHYENDICTKREVIKITAKNNDTFTITRWFAVCIMNDQTKQQGQWSQEFVVGDYLSLYLSKEIWESLTVWITTNETNIQTMVARINAPRTCINNNCQSWKNAIDSAYNTKCGGNAGFGTGADGDCVITTADLDSHWYKYLCASCEYNFNNLTICPWVEVRFLWNWVPTINVWDKFINCGCIDLRAWYVANATETDCWLEKGCTICNQWNSIDLCCGGAWWLWATYSEWRVGWTGATWCPWTASCWWAGGGGWSWYPWWAGCPWWSPIWENGWNGWRWWNCSAWYSWWWGGWWGGWWWMYWNGGNGWNGGAGDSWAHAHWVGGNGGNSGLFGTAWTGGEWWSDGNNGAWNGGNWYIWWTGGAGWFCWPAGNGGCGVKVGWTGGEAYSYRQAWNGGNAITNIYGFHLNARNIWNNCVDGRWWNGGKGWQAECWRSWNGWNGADGGQMIISYDCMHEQGCFDVRWWDGGEPWHVRKPSCWWTSGSTGSQWTNGWVVFRGVNNPYITNFNLESDGDNEAILISWKDPQIKQSSPQRWAKTVVRYSTTNYPTTPTSWTLAVQSTTKDQYETTPYSLTGVLDETTYYFSAFALDQNNTIIDVQSKEITTSFDWKPTENTIWYRPLLNDFNDKNWNYNLTDKWSTTLETIWWIKCAKFSNALTSWLYNDNIPIPSWNSAKTINLWMYPTSYNSAEDDVIFIWNWWSYNQAWIIYKINPLSFSQWWWSLSSSNNIALNTRTNVIISTTWNAVYMYINWQQVKTWSLTINTQWNKIAIWFWRWVNDKSTYRYIWYINRVILENKFWDSIESNQYFTKMKSKYWL